MTKTETSRGYLGVDPSYAKPLFVACCSNSDCGTLARADVDYRKIKSYKAHMGGVFEQQLAEAFSYYAQERNARILIVENPVHTQPGNLAFQRLSESVGVIKSVAIAQGVTPYLFPLPTMRRVLGILQYANFSLATLSPQQRKLERYKRGAVVYCLHVLGIDPPNDDCAESVLYSHLAWKMGERAVACNRTFDNAMRGFLAGLKYRQRRRRRG